MKNFKNIYIVLFSILIAFYGCQESKYEVGELLAPSNLTFTAEIEGADANNPNGDGAGYITFTAKADNVINYQFDFGDDKKNVEPTGIIRHRYTDVGVNTYNVIVNATGTGGLSSSTTIEVTVFSSFEDIETENLLSGTGIGDSKKWYWQADESGFVSMGPVTDDYGNGEFAYGAWWGGPDAWADDRRCFFENNEFVFTRTADGLTFEQTVGPAYVPGTYAGFLGVGGDQCHDETVATTMFGLKNVSVVPSESKASLEGSFNGNAYRGTSFEISDGGFMGWYAGASAYDIISITNDQLIVRVIENPASGSGAAWYHVFTSTKPVEDTSSGTTFDTLVWEDDFSTDGAPDAAKWTYDTGTGDNGWGNAEKQSYTDNAENVKVEGGNLIITAKADGNGGYTSARIKSQGLYNFKYGKVEVKAKLPGSAGTWPAIWMLGSNFTTVGWPTCGEIDIMEQTGDDKNTSLGTCHWFDSGTNANASYGETTAISNASSEFHIYSLEWTETEIKIFVDGVSFYTLSNSAALPFNDNFFLILNLAMGGSLGGDIDAGFTEDTMEIDYVKVFQ